MCQSCHQTTTLDFRHTLVDMQQLKETWPSLYDPCALSSELVPSPPQSNKTSVNLLNIKSFFIDMKLIVESIIEPNSSLPGSKASTLGDRWSCSGWFNCRWLMQWRTTRLVLHSSVNFGQAAFVCALMICPACWGSLLMLHTVDFGRLSADASMWYVVCLWKGILQQKGRICNEWMKWIWLLYF